MAEDIRWLAAHVETAMENTRTMISRMRESDGRIAPFVVYTPDCRLFWFPKDTAIGYVTQDEKKAATYVDEDTLCFVENVPKSGEFEMMSIGKPVDAEDMARMIFSFLKNRCGLDQLDCRRSCHTAERLDIQPYDAAMGDAEYDDGLSGEIGAGSVSA